MLDLIHQITLNLAYWADVHFPNVLDHQFTGGSFSNTMGETEHSKRKVWPRYANAMLEQINSKKLHFGLIE